MSEPSDEFNYTPSLPFVCDHFPRSINPNNPIEVTECQLCGQKIRYNSLIEPGPNRWEPVYDWVAVYE